MDVTNQVKGTLNKDFARSAAPVYDKVIVGGGMAGLQSAYEILRAAKKAGKDVKVAVVADTINAPALDGSNVVLGLDGFEADKYVGPQSFSPQEMSVLKQIRTAAMHVRAITWKEKMDCRFSMGYQFLGSDTRDDATKQVTTGAQNVKAAADWLVDVFGYKKDSIHYVDNSGIKFHGYDSVMQSNDIGQVNAPEYERGLVDAIKRMGATVITGVKYQSHEKLANGTIDVHTDAGDLMTKTSPLLATGVGQLQSLTAGKLPIKFNGVYTGAMHIQLAPDDIKKVCPGGKPMAYCDTNLSGDVIWGSIDSQGVLTMGFGDSDKWNGDQNKIDMQNKFREILPDIADKYLNGALKNNVTYSYGTMLEAENNFPLVGRMPDYDVMVGWASRGIVQSSAAAQAYANWVVNGNDKALKPWESLQPKVFAPQPQAHATRTPKTLKA